MRKIFKVVKSSCQLPLSRTLKNLRFWRPREIQVLPLDKMTDDESLEFIVKQLEIPESETEEFKEEPREFFELIGGLPLALQQAVAFIKHQKKVNELLNRRPYKMSDYVKEFKSSAEKLQKFPHAPDSSTTVFITWEIALKKIKEDPKGEVAIEVIELMSFLYADKIPVELLIQLLPHHNFWRWQMSRRQDGDLQSTNVRNGLILLENFSMIKITGDFVSVHRQVQFVITENLKSSESCEIFLSLHQIVNNPFDLIPMTERFLDFLNEFGYVLHEASRYSESLELYRTSYRKSLELLGENHHKIIVAQHGIAVQLHQLGRLDEALTLYKEVLEKEEIHFGVDHPETITTKHNMAEALRQQKKYEEALELFQQVSAQRNKIYGQNHPETLATQNAIAVLNSQLGDFQKALALYQNLEKKQIQSLGPDHEDALSTKHGKATVLFRLGKLEEASEIFNDNHEKRKEILGENHLDTIDTLECIATILHVKEKFKEALNIYKKVFEIRTTNLGENHPDTIIVKNSIVTIESKLRNKKETL